MSEGTGIQELIASGTQFHQAGKLDEAEALYRHALDKDRKNPAVLHLLGLIAYNRKNFAEAVKLIKRSIGLNRSALYYYNLGCVYRDSGDLANAVSAFKTSIKLNPAHQESYLSLALNMKEAAMADTEGLECCRHFLLDKAVAIKTKYSLLINLGYHITSTADWNNMLYHVLVLPTIEAALRDNQYGAAEILAYHTTMSIAQQPHEGTQWAYCHARVNDLFLEYGSRSSETLPKLESLSCGDFKQVGFIVDAALASGSGSHALVGFLQGIMSLEPLPFVPVVYALTTMVPQMVEALSAAGIPIVDMDGLRGCDYFADDPVQRLLFLRYKLALDGVGVVSFSSTYEGPVSYAAALPLAPVQIYFSMGFRSFQHPAIDGYITGGSPVKAKLIYEGREWRTVPTCVSDPFPPEASPEYQAIVAEAENIKKPLQARFKILFGCIARPQKIENISFMDALEQILRANPDAAFLWFSQELPSVKQMMAERGISDRCIFCGWVDSRVYAKVLDVHLDTFPFPSGFSMMDSLSASSAFVLMANKDRLDFSSNIEPLLDGSLGSDVEIALARTIFTDIETGETLALIAHSVPEYVAYANRLAGDAVYREKVGRAGRRFMEHFKHHTALAGSALAEHISEIVEMACLR